jgi:malate synthase
MAGTMNNKNQNFDDKNTALTLVGVSIDGYEKILTPQALAFVAKLENSFGNRRRELLVRRGVIQAKFNAGGVPKFRDDTKHIREGGWKILGTPDDLQDRRVEITGPVERKMMINAFGCGANVFMTDFEDANSPTWQNTINGQVNLYDFARGIMEHTDPRTGKEYSLSKTPAVLKVRPRGWHLEEAHVALNGARISAGIFDFGLHFFHNAKNLIARGTGPYFYLPKMECYEEAQLWNDVFTMAQSLLDVPYGTIKTTVLIETLPAAFEMDEILYALKDHIVGLNCGRWDYIFSFIKCLGRNPNYLLPDRSQVVMGEGFLKAYSLLLIKTCHRRGAHAMGGMAAQIPIKNDEDANNKALAKVKADKEREVSNGHDGTWVAHPALVKVAKDVFDAAMPTPNQIDRLRDDVEISEQNLLEVHKGERTEGGLRENLRVGVQYLAAWLDGRGAVPLYNLMEDAATAEISRSQIWQWRSLGASLSDGRVVDEAFIGKCFDDEMSKLLSLTSDENIAKKLNIAADLFRTMIFSDNPPEFLTLPAYELII